MSHIDVQAECGETAACAILPANGGMACQNQIMQSKISKPIIKSISNEINQRTSRNLLQVAAVLNSKSPECCRPERER
jgi:hypothetical protein